MKRIINVVLMSIFCLLFVACGDSNEHIGEAKTPSGSAAMKGRDYQSVVEDFEEKGFTNIKLEKIEDLVFGWLTEDGEVEEVSVGGDFDYSPDKWVNADIEVVIRYHTFPGEEEGDVKQEAITEASEELEENVEQEVIIETSEELEENVEQEVIAETSEESEEIVESEADETSSVLYSTNDYETAKNGNTGVFAYKQRGASYDIYWIIDFDEGYVYFFTDGNGDSSCDRVKIESGDLNSNLVITYHDGGDEWSYGLHFKYVSHPATLIMIDNDGFDYEYSTTDLEDALALKSTKTINDY